MGGAVDNVRAHIKLCAEVEITGRRRLEEKRALNGLEPGGQAVFTGLTCRS